MLAQKLVLGYSSRLFSQVLTVLAGIVVARLAGPTVIGTVAFGMSFVSVFQFLGDLGLGSAHIRLVSLGHDLGECNGTYWRLKLVLTALLVIVVGGLLVVQRIWIRDAFETPEHFYVAGIWLLTVAISQLLLYPMATFTGLMEQAKQDVPSVVQTVVVQILRITAVVAGLGAIGLSTAQLVGASLLGMTYFWLVRNYPVRKYNTKLAREYLVVALPLAVIMFSTAQLEYLDKVLLQYYSDSTQVGLYSAALSIAFFTRTIGSTAGMLFFPLFSGAVAQSNYVLISETIRKFQRVAYLIIMPLTILLMVFASPIIWAVLGSHFAPSSPILSSAVVGNFFYVVNLPYANLVLGMNRLKLGAMLQVLNLVGFVGLDIVAITFLFPDAPGFGTAIALATSSIAFGFACRLTVQRLSPTLQVPNDAKYILSGLVVAACAYVAYSTLDSSGNPMTAAIAGALLVAALPVFFLFAKWAHPADVRMLLKMFDVRSLRKYVADEFSKVEPPR